MGWTFTRRRRGETDLEFWSHEFHGEKGRVLDVATVHFTEVYIAYGVWRSGYDEGTEPDEVYAIVCRAKWVPNAEMNFGFKDMDESVYPYCFHCPERILRLLTPTGNKNAQRWREAYWKNIHKRSARPKLKPGDLVLFPEEIHFSSGEKRHILQVVPAGRKLRFGDYPTHGGHRRVWYQVRRENLNGAVTISSPNPRAEMNPSAHLQVLVAERGAEATGRAHAVIEQLGLFARVPLKDPERAAERMADLLRTTLELVDRFGERKVGEAYHDIAYALLSGKEQEQRRTLGKSARFSQELAQIVRAMLVSDPEPSTGRPGGRPATGRAVAGGKYSQLPLL
jgi:hypothetical protein